MLTQHHITTQVRATIAQRLGLDIDSIPTDSTLTDMNLDSFDLAEITVSLERIFCVQLQALTPQTTVRSIISAMQQSNLAV